MSETTSTWKRFTGLTARITFAIFLLTAIFPLVIYFLSRENASDTILKHEMDDLADESSDNCNDLILKLEQLRSDVLALTSDRRIREPVYHPDLSPPLSPKILDRLRNALDDTPLDALDTYFNRTEDRTDPRKVAWLPGVENESVYIRAAVYARTEEDPPTLVGMAVNPSIFADDATPEFRREADDDALRDLRGLFAEADRRHERDRRDVYISDILTNEKTGRCTVWAVVVLPPAEYESIPADSKPRSGYVGLQLNWSRMIRDLDRTNRMLIFLAGKTGGVWRFYEHPVQDHLLTPGRESELRRIDDGMKGVVRYENSEQAGNHSPEQLQRMLEQRYEDLGSRSSTLGNAFKSSRLSLIDIHRYFMVGFIGPDSIRDYYEKFPEEREAAKLHLKFIESLPAERNADRLEVDPYKLHYMRMLWKDMFALREKYSTLRFLPPLDPARINSVSDQRFMVNGPLDAAGEIPVWVPEVRAVFEKYSLAKTKKSDYWVMNALRSLNDYSAGPMETYGLYLEKIPLDKTAAVTSDDPKTEKIRFLMYGSAASYEEIEADIRQNLWILTWLLYVSLATCVLFAIGVSKTVTKPLQGLLSAIQHVGTIRGIRDDAKLPVERRDEIGQLARAFYEMNDELRIKEDRLRDEKGYALAIVNAVGEGIVTFDDEGKIIGVNVAARKKLFHYKSDSQVIGKNFAELFAQDDWNKDEDMENALRSIDSQVASFTIMQKLHEPTESIGLRADGTTFPMEYNLSEFPHGGNRFYTAIVRDISDRKKYEDERRQRRKELEREVERKTQTIRESKRKIEETYQKLESEQRLKDTFLLALTHETNNLLVPIMGHATALARKMADDPMVVDRATKIRRSSERIQQLSNECKNYQKLVMGKVDLTPREFDLTDLVQGVAEQLEPRAEKNDSRIVLENVESLGKIVSDQERINQVLTNLVGNACKFTKNGTITVTGCRLGQSSGNFVRIDIRDTGIGMSVEQTDKLFKPFPMISTKEQNPDGTGLGLALCKDLCRILGGDISASSEQGVGSTFSVVLPVELVLDSAGETSNTNTISTFQAVVDRVNVEAVGKTRRVLVIDDDPNVCDLMREFLENHGMVISTALDGQSGLEAARTLKPDVITLDAMMPNMDGWTVLTLLKSDPQTQRIPVVMVTVADDRKRGIALGVSDYFTKPIDWPRLTAMLQNYTGGKAAPRILVIDDQPGTREMCRETLAGHGWIVVEAGDGVTGLAQVDATAPAVILLDLLMPNMDGFQFLEALRNRPHVADIPVIVMTAKDLTAEDRLRLNARVAGVIMKEQSTTEDLLKQMLHRVKQILDSRADPKKEVSVG